MIVLQKLELFEDVPRWDFKFFLVHNSMGVGALIIIGELLILFLHLKNNISVEV